MGALLILQMKSKKISRIKSRNKKVKISVIIPTLNSWNTLNDCVISILKQSIKPYEVIVVDNASDKSILRKIRTSSWYEKIKLVTSKRNMGVTGGRNSGIKNASRKTDYYFFFDHDMIAEPTMLEELVKVSKNSSSVGIVTPKIYYWEDKNRVWAAGTNMNLLTGQVLFRGGRDEGQFEKIEEVQVAPAAFLVKKKVIDEIHGFDDQYFATYEDTDFCFRAKDKGFRIIYTPYAISYHQISPEPKKERQRLLVRAFWVGRNRILFMGDYAENFYLFLLFSPVYLLYFIKLALQEGDFKGLVNFVNGYIAGLIEELFARRVLFYIPYSIYNSIWRSIGGGKKTVLDVGCGDGRIMDIINNERKWKITGVDIYEPDVLKARDTGAYKEVIVGDILNIDKRFKTKYDVIFCSNVLEHLYKKNSLNMLLKFEKLGKKIVIIVPRGFLEKEDPYYFEGDNPYQIHKSAWQIDEFREKGYVVRGIGVNFLLGDKRMTNNKMFSKYKFLLPIKQILVILENILAYLFAPISFYYPDVSTGILAIKDVRG